MLHYPTDEKTREAPDCVPQYGSQSSTLTTTSSSLDSQVDSSIYAYRQHLPHPSDIDPPPYVAFNAFIAIPQSSLPSLLHPPAPFLRAYPPILAAHGISMNLFLSIVDALNFCLAPPPPLQALSVIGEGIGFVPHHWAQGVSAGIGLAAGLGNAATRIMRLKRFQEAVNVDVFAPRGLRMEVLKDDVLMNMLRADAHHLAGMANLDPMQRLRGLGALVAPLSFDVPPPAAANGMLEKISAKQTASTLTKNEKAVQKKVAKREIHLVGADGEDADARVGSSRVFKLESKMAKLDEDAQRLDSKISNKQLDGKHAAKMERKQQKELAGLEKDRQKLHDKHDKAIGKVLKKQDKQQLKDKEKAAKLEWICIHSV